MASLTLPGDFHRIVLRRALVQLTSKILSDAPVTWKYMENFSQCLAERGFALRAYSFYSGLVAHAAQPKQSAESSLGGKLLYVGELDEDGRAVVVASNVAGATSLSATADAERQRQAIRDGIVDFVVNSLDEALRILKNEIRKREAVSVCVAQPPELIEAEMRERGVLPDLLRAQLQDQAGRAAMEPNPQKDGGEGSDPMSAPALVVWSVASAPAHWLPRLDVLAMDSLTAEAAASRRWLRLSARYLGRTARNVRLVRSERRFAAAFVERVRASFEAGELGDSARIEVSSAAGVEEHRFAPKAMIR